jgi:hypothetical protein
VGSHYEQSLEYIPTLLEAGAAAICMQEVRIAGSGPRKYIAVVESRQKQQQTLLYGQDQHYSIEGLSIGTQITVQRGNAATICKLMRGVCIRVMHPCGETVRRAQQSYCESIALPSTEARPLGR